MTDSTRRHRRGHRTSIWTTRLTPSSCYVCLHPDDEDRIAVWIPDGAESDDGLHRGWLHSLDRREARLLARRLNECLDATVLP